MQPFFENTCIEGTTLNIYCFRAQNSGGTVIKALDTLDSKFDQISHAVDLWPGV